MNLPFNIQILIVTSLDNLFRRNDSGSGLRMKISAIPAGNNTTATAAPSAAPPRPNSNANKLNAPATNHSAKRYDSTEELSQLKHPTFSNAMQKNDGDSSDNTSFCSDCSDSDDSDSSSPSTKNPRPARNAATPPKRKPQRNGERQIESVGILICCCLTFPNYIL